MFFRLNLPHPGGSCQPLHRERQLFSLWRWWPPACPAGARENGKTPGFSVSLFHPRRKVVGVSGHHENGWRAQVGRFTVSAAADSTVTRGKKHGLRAQASARRADSTPKRPLRGPKEIGQGIPCDLGRLFCSRGMACPVAAACVTRRLQKSRRGAGIMPFEIAQPAQPWSDSSGGLDPGEPGHRDRSSASGQTPALALPSLLSRRSLP